MKIAFIGYGNVGAPLADHLQRLGHDVSLAANNPHSEAVQKALALNPNLQVQAAKQAVKNADVVFLATPFDANEAALKPLAAELKGKVLVDCTNPVAPNLTHGLNNVRSGSALVQVLVPDSKVVKAFTIYGFENFQTNQFPAYNVKPAMLFCGNDKTAKATVAELIENLGWEAVDVGGLDQALHLEHMTLLWIKMIRLQGADPHTVWARLTKVS
jgi:hypothetical protein